MLATGITACSTDLLPIPTRNKLRGTFLLVRVNTAFAARADRCVPFRRPIHARTNTPFQAKLRHGGYSELTIDAPGYGYLIRVGAKTHDAKSPPPKQAL